MKEISKEWFITAPWGKLALISWGNPNDYPLLLVHGREDSAATFLPLLKILPENYYYVAMDLPGNGKSDPFPKGILIARFTFVPAVDIVLRHLKWTDFYYIGHSLGTELGLYYNVIYPNRIRKFILFDPVPPILKIQVTSMRDYLKSFYHSYYDNYHKQYSNDKIYNRQQAIEAVMKARSVSEEDAVVLLSRSMIKLGDDKFQLSWDRRQRILATLNLEDDFYVKLFSIDSPPTLIINAAKNPSLKDGGEKAYRLLNKIQSQVENFTILDVDGDHDVHFKKPELYSKDVCDFINKSFSGKAKM